MESKSESIYMNMHWFSILHKWGPVSIFWVLINILSCKFKLLEDFGMIVKCWITQSTLTLHWLCALNIIKMYTVVHTTGIHKTLCIHVHNFLFIIYMYMYFYMYYYISIYMFVECGYSCHEKCLNNITRMCASQKVKHSSPTFFSKFYLNSKLL